MPRVGEGVDDIQQRSVLVKAKQPVEVCGLFAVHWVVTADASGLERQAADEGRPEADGRVLEQPEIDPGDQAGGERQLHDEHPLEPVEAEVVRDLEQVDEDVGDVVHPQDDEADSDEVVARAEPHQRDGDDVVGHHDQEVLLALVEEGADEAGVDPHGQLGGVEHHEGVRRLELHHGLSSRVAVRERRGDPHQLCRVLAHENAVWELVSEEVHLDEGH
mmetsp:Transcript_16569/g.62710  ORF Transcript_16569/g.62710 Transcript_16569/m.62710 type:complete len:218 (-) Transcript_16569:46-699(-)